MSSSPLFCCKSRRYGDLSQQTLVHPLIALVLTTATACCTRSTSMPRKLYSQFIHSAARFIVRKWKFGSNTQPLRDGLRWLSVRQRIVYKLCIIIYRCLHQTVPKYLQELCVPVTITASRRHLHSAARGDLHVLATITATLGPHSFAASAPKLWNSLPLRDWTLTIIMHTGEKRTCFCLATEAPRDCLGCKGCAL